MYAIGLNGCGHFNTKYCLKIKQNIQISKLLYMDFFFIKWFLICIFKKKKKSDFQFADHPAS